MTSNNEELKKMDQTKQEQNKKQSTKLKSGTYSTVSKNKFSLISGTFIVALGALTTAFYSLSINQKIHNQLTQTNSQLLAQIQQLEQQQNKNQTHTEDKTNKVAEAQAVLQTQLDALNKELHLAMNERYYQNEHWILLKTRYYLELAQINAHWSKSSSATIALLQQANQLVHEFNEPKIFNLRQAIAQDIAQLQAMPTVDIVGILGQLDAAQNNLKALSIMTARITDKPTNTNDSPSSQSTLSAWNLHLQDSINLLNKLVVIRHNEKPIEPFISPKFEALLKENIHLNLQEAQWAVLNNNPQIYQLVLNQAISTLKNNFNEGEQNTDALIKILIELQHVPLDQKIPDISSALPIINQLIDEKKPMSSPSVTNKQGEN